MYWSELLKDIFTVLDFAYALHTCLKVASHCRSDQLDYPDPQNFLIKPDQARLKGVYRTSS